MLMILLPSPHWAASHAAPGRCIRCGARCRAATPTLDSGHERRHATRAIGSRPSAPASAWRRRCATPGCMRRAGSRTGACSTTPRSHRRCSPTWTADTSGQPCNTDSRFGRDSVGAGCTKVRIRRRSRRSVPPRLQRRWHGSCAWNDTSRGTRCGVHHRMSLPCCLHLAFVRRPHPAPRAKRDRAAAAVPRRCCAWARAPRRACRPRSI